MAHEVSVSLPNAMLGNSDVIIDVFKDNSKLGTITISKGRLEWYPKNAKKPYKMTWSQFDKMMKEWHQD